MFSKQAKSGKSPARIEPLPTPMAVAPVEQARRSPPKVASLLSADLTIEGNLTGEGELQIDGVVSYAGVRSGYGNVVEIDHGNGFKTRYAHLQASSVRVGQRVAIGQRIAAMGSTGRSTGPHLHYEVWVNGRAQNPNRFLKAGEYVQQAS